MKGAGRRASRDLKGRGDDGTKGGKGTRQGAW